MQVVMQTLAGFEEDNLHDLGGEPGENWRSRLSVECPEQSAAI